MSPELAAAETSLPAGGPHEVVPQTSATNRVLLQVTNLVKHFPIRSRGLIPRTIGQMRAVDGVSFALHEQETLGLVGESGCGKTTTGRLILRLLEPTSGSIQFLDQELTTLNRRELRPLRRDIQIVFQDPYASLNPRLTINSIIAEPLIIHGLAGRDRGRNRVAELLAQVGLNPDHGNRYPHEFSGGQRQRIGIARALALNPQVLILDEPVSALDVSIQAGIINLLKDLRKTIGLSYVFVAHDLSVVRHISDRVAVMYLGKIVEIGDRAEVFDQPAHPYTQALISAIPIPDPNVERARQRILLTGDVPSADNVPSGCPFRTRCPKFARELTDSQQTICRDQIPALIDRGNGHSAACHFSTPATSSQANRSNTHNAWRAQN